MLFVPRINNNFLSVLAMEDMRFVVMFKKEKVLICPEGDSPNTTMRIGVRERNLYSL